MHMREEIPIRKFVGRSQRDFEKKICNAAGGLDILDRQVQILLLNLGVEGLHMTVA